MTTTDPAERLPTTVAGRAFHEQLRRGVTFVRSWDAEGKDYPDHAAPAILAIEDAAYQRGKNEALNGPRIGVRLRDAFWIDSRHYDHYHDYGDTVTHEVGEWCPHQLIGQNYPCPPSHDEVAAERAILDAGADR